jgi:hypothetical protein
VPNSALVFGIPLTADAEEPFLVNEPPNQKGHGRRDRDESQYEPSASGAPRRYSDALAYIGCRTTE